MDTGKDHLQSHAKRNLTGWAAIEDYIQKHDGGEVKDYVDDIDTLLVFAGLFSAILTAFVVQSYPMLQENTGQTTNQLLSTISSQMGSAASGQSTAATGAAGSSPANPPFIPSTSARWINSLFFLALVFSLSAALFGILAKQWLREYMHWNSTLGAARENVLIRQLRYEALGDWHVAATISSIPALLEVAMIMFFIGIVILLWTIDTVVAIVVTTSVAAFLGLVAAFTVLPVIFRRCPYKSPTAWACFVLCHLVSATVAYTGRFAAAYVQNLRHGHWQLHNIKIRWPRRPRSWRQREELVEGLEHPHRSSFQVSEETLRGVRCALVAERVGLNGSRTLAEALPFPTSALKDVTEVSVLFRALSWVHKASQDLRVKEYVKQSMETIHVRRPENIDTLGVTNVTDWCILWSLQTGNLRRPEAALSTADSGVNAVQQNVRDMWLLERLNILGEQRNVARARQRIQYGAVNLAIPADDAPLLADLIAADLKSAVSDLLAVSVEDVKRSTFPVLGRIVLELLCVMGSMCTSRTVSVHDHHLHGIRDLVCQRESKLLVDTALPGLRSSALIIACRISNVTSNEGKLSVFRRNSHMSALDYCRLICDYYGGDIHDYSPEDLAIFVLLTYEWLLYVSHRSSPPEVLEHTETIVQKMADAAEYTLRSRILNCGCYFHLPWIARLWHSRRRHFQVTDISVRKLQAYLRLVHALEQLQVEGLITGPDQELLPRLIAAIHSEYADCCMDPECRFVVGPRS